MSTGVQSGTNVLIKMLLETQEANFTTWLVKFKSKVFVSKNSKSNTFVFMQLLSVNFLIQRSLYTILTNKTAVRHIGLEWFALYTSFNFYDQNEMPRTLPWHKFLWIKKEKADLE